MEGEMNRAKIEAVRREAMSVIHKADDVLAKDLVDKYVFITGCKETSALKRASLDLTRALAEMRKSN
jgi:hypothetical protein